MLELILILDEISATRLHGGCSRVALIQYVYFEVVINTEYKHLVVIFIFAEVYIYTIIKLVDYSSKTKNDAQIQQLSQKYKTDESYRRCSVSVQNTTPAQ